MSSVVNVNIKGIYIEKHNLQDVETLNSYIKLVVHKFN